jgi:hypothetical protein
MLVGRGSRRSLRHRHDATTGAATISGPGPNTSPMTRLFVVRDRSRYAPLIGLLSVVCLSSSSLAQSTEDRVTGVEGARRR